MAMIALVCSFITAFGAAGPTTQQARTDSEQLQGTWELMGFYALQPSGPQGKVIIEGSNLNFHPNRVNFTFKLDQTKTPKQIDLIPLNGAYKGIKHFGIYELDGNELKLCIAAIPANHRSTAKDRPIGFDESKAPTMTLVRKK